jgi:hypothetical protein
MEDTHVKMLRIQSTNDLTSIAHLRVGETGIGKAIHEDANQLQAHLGLKQDCDGGNGIILSGKLRA